MISTTHPRKAARDWTWQYRLRITLLDVRPAIWRELLVPETITLPKLHMAIQHAMGWTNSHLHEFIIRGRHYTDYLEEQWDDKPLVDERRVRLESALGHDVRTFDYVYDFGDDWHHAVVVEAREPQSTASAAAATCVAGARACPPEDVGGTHGYEEFLSIVSDPEHPEHRDTMTWCGGAFDPERFDIEAANRRLAKLKV